MENGFDLEMYETLFKNCFIEYSTYKNGDLQLSLYGTDPSINETAHFADITLEQNLVNLQEDEIVVNNLFRPTLIPQLEKLGLLKKLVKSGLKGNGIYPVYKIDFSKITQKYCYMPELMAA